MGVFVDGFDSRLAFCRPPGDRCPAAANNTVGAWSTVHSWPLIAVHAVLMPDGRVLSYGTTASGQQTGNSIYAVWDPSEGLDAGHMTLANTTGTDIFCSSQVLVPQGNQVFIAGGDNWTGTGTTNTGNNNSNTFNYGNDTLTRNANMNRPRWYSSSIALLNGEIYIQGGSGGTDRPEIRDVEGAFRLLSGANTSDSTSCFRATSSHPTAGCSASTAPAACTTSIRAARAR